MNGQGPSPMGVEIATLFDSLDMQKGDLSYRMEGMLQVVSILIPKLTSDDRKHIAEAIIRACERFSLYDKKSGVSINRYAQQTLQDLSSF